MARIFWNIWPFLAMKICPITQNIRVGIGAMILIKDLMGSVVAQLVEWSPPTPEICVLNPVIGKTFIEHLFTVNCVEKTKIKKNEAGNWPFI